MGNRIANTTEQGAPTTQAGLLRYMALMRHVLQQALIVFNIVLLIGLSAVVVLAVVFRKMGASLIWYDEVASIMLAWLTFYGACLAALKGRHLAFSGFLHHFSPNWRRFIYVIIKLFILSFLAAITWAGYGILDLMAGEALISLEWFPMPLAQSALPVACSLYFLIEVLIIPEDLDRLDMGVGADDIEIREAMEANEVPQ